jgi:hypothetical protein
VIGKYSLEQYGSNKEGQHTSVTDIEIFYGFDLIDSAHYDPPLHDECRVRSNAFV